MRTTQALLTTAVDLAAQPAFAATLSWDPGITGAASGGSTTSEATEWKTSGAGTVWYDADLPGNVVWTDGNDATFAGTAGNVRLGGNNATISVGALNFAVAGYTIDLKDFTDNTANNLTVTGISGSSATITNTSGTTRNFTINNATDQTWSGTISSQRIVLIKQGVGTLGFTGTLPGGFGANTVEVQNGKLEFTGTVNAQSSGAISVGANGSLDLRGNHLGIANANDGFRRLATAAGSTLTSSTGGTAEVRFGFGGQTHDVNGTVSGNLRFRFNRGGGEILNLGGNNSFTGGILFNNLFSGSGTVNANHDNALGTGSIDFGNANGTARVNLRTAAPSIGSLTGSGAGTRQIVLGNTGIDTAVTIDQSVTGTFTGAISQFTGQVGSLIKAGNSTLTLNGTNTYTGSTTITAGTLALGASGSLASTVLDVEAGTFDASAAAALPAFTSISGDGTINVGTKTVTLAAGGTVAPGNSPGDLDITGGLDIAALADTGGLLFELGALSDGINVTGDLALGTLNFADFTFTPGAGFGVGSYTLIDGDGSVSGGIGTASGIISYGGDDFIATLGIADGNNVVLDVVIPEPASLALMGVAGLVLLPRRRSA